MQALVVRREILDGGEAGTSYRLTLEYKPPISGQDQNSLTATLTVTLGTTLDYAMEGDVIPVRLNPRKPSTIVQEDVTELTWSFRLYFFVGLIFGIPLVYKLLRLLF